MKKVGNGVRCKCRDPEASGATPVNSKVMMQAWPQMRKPIPQRGSNRMLAPKKRQNQVSCHGALHVRLFLMID